MIVVQLDDAQLKLSLANSQARPWTTPRSTWQIGEDNANQDNPKLVLQVKSAQSALDSAQETLRFAEGVCDLGRPIRLEPGYRRRFCRASAGP